MSKMVNVNSPFRYSLDGFTIIPVPVGDQELSEEAVRFGVSLGAILEDDQKESARTRRGVKATAKAD